MTTSRSGIRLCRATLGWRVKVVEVLFLLLLVKQFDAGIVPARVMKKLLNVIRHRVHAAGYNQSQLLIQYLIRSQVVQDAEHLRRLLIKGIHDEHYPLILERILDHGFQLLRVRLRLAA